MVTESDDWAGEPAEEADERADEGGEVGDDARHDARGSAGRKAARSETKALRRGSRGLLRSLLRPHRRSIVGLSLVLVAQNVAAMAGPYLIMVGIDRGIPALTDGRGPWVLTTVVAAFVASAVGQGVATRYFLERSGRVGQSVLYDLRSRVFGHFQDLSLSFHERYTSGRVISRVTSDVDSIAELLDDGLSKLVFAGLSIASTAILLLVLDVPMALVVFASFPFLIALTMWFRRQAEKAYRAKRAAVAAVIVHFVETFGGIRAVQSFRREEGNDAIFTELSRRNSAASGWASRLAATFGPGTDAIGAITVAVTLVYGADRVLSGATTLGVLAAFVLYLGRFFGPMEDLAQFFNAFQESAAALEKLSGVLEEEPSVPEPGNPRPLERPAGEIRFDAVEFGYAPDRPVLPRLDLFVPAGQTVALVGETGSGKTTLARLIARFYDPTAGAVRLDGVDLRDLSNPTLRSAVVMVTQESFLFTGSVFDNIAFGRPHATAEEVVAATRAIGAHDVFDSLPGGYFSEVGKRGGRLAAGQRQLVALARAFLADPRVLILDEATASLDIPHERLVQEALRTLLADRTAFIVAHRLSTVEIADRVLVVDGGRVIEDGHPTTLVRQGGRYAALHQAWRHAAA